MKSPDIPGRFRLPQVVWLRVRCDRVRRRSPRRRWL